ncbi:MAG TPA: hypothetical protein VK722_19005 [Candidatus Aquilonibacter sp.]|jgi:hypothetical protein|nr:hypothetical protein [Candidatus Aquilonibacter sp.]
MRVYVASLVVVLGILGAAFGQETNFARGPQYLMNSGSSLFARSISTPSTSLSGPPLEVGASTATAGLTAGADDRDVSVSTPDALPHVNFSSIYYGTNQAVPASVIEISSSVGTSHTELPASILDTGVLQITTAQTLRLRGYGVTLGEAAAYDRAHAVRAKRVYTNADIERLHKGS